MKMKFLHATVVLAVSLCTSFAGCQENRSETRCILAALPTETLNPVSVSDIPIFTLENNITLIGVRSELEHNLVVDFVVREFQCNLQENARITSDCSCSEVIGVVGDLDSGTASIIHTLASRSNLNITLVAAVAPSTFLPVTNLALPNVLDMNPLVHYIEALVSFTDQLNWTHIGLISDGSLYHEFAAEVFQTQLLSDLELSVAPNFRLDKKSDIIHALKVVKEYETHIIFASLDYSSTCLLLEEARKMNMIWPDYAWIVFDYSYNSMPGYSCGLEGVIVLKQDIELNYHNKSCSETNSSSVESLSSSQSRVLHDSVLAVVLADSIEGIDISNMSFIGATGLVKFRNGQRLNTIDIVQVINGTLFDIGSYDSELEQFTLNSSYVTSGDMPRGTKVIVYAQNSRSQNALTLVSIFLSFLFVSIILFFYIFFRKEDEIKATSFTISLCMFLGCYLHLFSTLLILVEAWRFSGANLPADIICNIIAWLGTFGIPSSLILATLLVKMARIYAIFLKPFSYKKKLYSNYFLFLYILLIISPNAIILILWSSIDPVNKRVVNIPSKSKLNVFERCSSKHFLVWFALELLYKVILIMAVVLVAIKTSAIRYKHFQDTKSTNAFAFIAILLLIKTISYLVFFNSLTFSIDSFNSLNITLYITDILFVILCQILLFLPKVLPPLRRWVFRNEVKNKPQQVIGFVM